MSARWTILRQPRDNSSLVPDVIPTLRLGSLFSPIDRVNRIHIICYMYADYAMEDQCYLDTFDDESLVELKTHSSRGVAR